MHIQELARRLGADADAALDFEVRGLATIEDAGPRDVTFLANPKYMRSLWESKAGAVFVSRKFEEEVRTPLLRVDDPYLAFAKALEHFHAYPRPPLGIHPTAVVGKDVAMGSDVAIGPYVVIGDGARIGDGVVIHPHVVVYTGATIGPGSELHSFCVIREHVRLGGGVIVQNGAVIGADGFGFAPQADRRLYKIPQAGTVVLADDVEIQANACVDRATIGATTIGRGTKVDNLAQIGHGCHVGEDTLVCGQVGLAGSTSVGSRTILAGQVGVGGHCEIGDDIQIAAQSGLAWDVREPGAYGGTPLMDMRTFRQWIILQPKIPALLKRVKSLEAKLSDLELG